MCVRLPLPLSPTYHTQRYQTSRWTCKGVFWLENICSAKLKGVSNRFREDRCWYRLQREEMVLHYYDPGSSRWAKVQSAGTGAKMSHPSELEPLDTWDCPVEFWGHRQLCRTSLLLLFCICIVHNCLPDWWCYRQLYVPEMNYYDSFDLYCHCTSHLDFHTHQQH